MEHCAHRGGNVGHVCGGAGAALFYIPTHKDEGDVGVVWIPRAVRRTFIVGTNRAMHVTTLKHHHDVAAPVAVIAVEDALAKE